LLTRVRRLVQRRPAAPTLAEGVMAGVLLLLGLGLLGTSVVLAGPRTTSSSRLNGFGTVANGAADDTTKRQALTVTQVDSTKTVTSTVTSSSDSVHDLELLPGGRARAMVYGTRVEFDTLMNPDMMHRSRPRRNEPGTVVIEKDKKGRIKSLVVNGEPVEIAATKLTKAERKAGKQVTVVQVPPASSSRNLTFGYSKSFDEDMAKKMDNWAREFDQKMDRKMEKVSKKLDKATHSYVYVTPGTKLSQNRNASVHINIDDEALNQLANNAVALGSMSLSLGLQAAAEGIEEARRSLETTLREPDLDPEARRATSQALEELNRDQSKSRHKHLERADDDHAEEARDRAEARAEEARERAEEARDRRWELQERIREAQEELRDLEESRRDGGETIRKPRPPRAPLAPLAPMAKMAPPAPPVPPRAPHKMVPPPPAPPADNSGKIRDALRKDGLIGKNDKNFQFQLSNDGLKVNGKEQSAETAAKYRKLLDVPATPAKGKGKTSINISVQGD
jgi:hypothetical protein